jgi:putative flippase GtrA
MRRAIIATLVSPEFIKYFVTGVSGVGLDMGTLFVLKHYGRLTPTHAIIVNQALMLAYIFLLNKHWSFKSKGGHAPQAVKFGMLAGFNYTFSILWMHIGNGIFGFHYLLVRLVNIALATLWNFILYKTWVFK